MSEDEQAASRPDLGAELSETEFRRWYFTLAELQVFARELGASASDSKAAVSDRIAAVLAGREPSAGARPSTADKITEPLTVDTVIPPNQRSTQALREFFRAEIGPTFRFNGHMRGFLAAGGATLAEAIEHWHRTAGTPLPKQSDSLEFNRFTKAWHAAHPNGSSADSRDAWQTYRSLPVDQRPPVADL